MKLVSSMVLIMSFGLAALFVGVERDEGKPSFEKRCSGCHDLDNVKAGPKLRGVFGRPAGKEAGFPYSESLKGAQFIWDERTLDKWLTDPESMAADTDMAFRLGDKGERAKIIEYLKQQTKNNFPSDQPPMIIGGSATSLG